MVVRFVRIASKSVRDATSWRVCTIPSGVICVITRFAILVLMSMTPLDTSVSAKNATQNWSITFFTN